MNKIKKTLLGVATIALLGAACAVVFQKQIGTLLLQRAAAYNVGRNILPTLPDGLHIALCGSGSPFPDPTRAGPCTAAVAGDRMFIVDAGEGSMRNVARINGLPPFLLQRWAMAMATAQSPLPVYGPTGATP